MGQKGKQNSALVSEVGASCSPSVNQTAILEKSENSICQRRVCCSHFAGFFKDVFAFWEYNSSECGKKKSKGKGRVSFV